MRLAYPESEQRCPLNCKFVAVGRATQPVKEAFNRKSSKDSLVVFALGLGNSEQTRSYGSSGILDLCASHRASIYGRMTLLTRQILA
jgi:hypothetical protein